MWRRFGSFREKRAARKRLSGLAIFRIVEQELRNVIPIAKHRWRRHDDFDYLNPHIEAATKRAELAEANKDDDSEAAAWLLALVLRAPRAARAQAQMDKYKHNYKNKSARVLELIDFNDAYVSTVLVMPEDHIHLFNDELKKLIAWFCKRVGAWTFSNDQFHAIVHGLSREIAVFNTVKSAGYNVRMASRTDDAFGIDMVITDPNTMKSINIDTKTASAFHYRLIDLLREGRLSELDIELAEKRGYTAVFNGHGENKARVMLWRIDHRTLGDISDFRFDKTEGLIAELKEMLNEYGE